MTAVASAPPPDLRIVRVEAALPHEQHDSQRALPLIAQLREADTLSNPPIVAPIDSSRFVILDGANRCYSFAQLSYPHILVQVVSYDSGYVALDTWRHIVSDWNASAFQQALAGLPHVRIGYELDPGAICHVVFKDGRLIALSAPVQNTHERNAVLREVVALYQQNARLSRTAMAEPEEVWPLYPEAIAMVMFPRYVPSDVIAAAKFGAYLPPGISRHIIHGRALAVNFPMDLLRDPHIRLSEKNERLQYWLQNKLANRAVRYYAEATYQFSE